MYFIDTRLFHGKIIEQRMRVPPMRTYIPGEKSSARKDTKINEERRSVLEYRNTLYTLSERDTGPFSRRTGIIISSAPCRDRYEHGPVKGARGEATMKRTSAAASRGKRWREDRERSRYTLQVRARVSRAANEPAAARLLATRSQLLICD